MLNDNQYASSSKYEARIYLNKTFAVNKQSKYAWIFEHFPKNENLRVLELGCGTGLFWLANRNSFPRNILYAFLESRGSNFRFSEFSFSLDNGMEQLKKSFAGVELVRRDNRLIINEVEPIINYYLSFNEIHGDAKILPDEYVDDFRRYLRGILDKEKQITVIKDDGIFICKKG
jgi:SAM-dependent methyltransferase